MKNKGNRKVTVTLIIVPDDKKTNEKNITDMYHVFVTNISGRHAKAKQEHLIDAYKKRWGIETGYMQIER